MVNKPLKGGGPAFPYPPSNHSLFVQPVLSTGMTLRDYFAASVVSRLVPEHVYSPATVAEEAYALADAMIAERDK